MSDRLPGERAYAALSRAAFDVALLAARSSGAPAGDLRARRGFLPAPDAAPLFWFHGASAGEIAAAENLAALLRGAGYGFTSAYTAANRAGVDRASAVSGALVSLAPWDSRRWVERAFERWRPRAFFLVETELWPWLVLTAARRGVPVFAVSARIYPRDAPRYALVRRFVGPLLERFTAILAQSAAERDRFLGLGAAPERCSVAGNLKHLGGSEPAERVERFAREVGCRPGERIVAVGSVHADEASPLLAALAPLVTRGVRVIVAPRRPDGIRAVANECRRQGWPLRLRSGPSAESSWRVLVLDTFGELERAYAVAALAIVGGGFGAHGGHNPFEPLRAGAPVLVGPRFHHFASEAASLRAAAPETECADAAQAGARAGTLLADDARRARLLERQRSALPDAGRIARAYLDAIAPSLDAAGLAPDGSPPSAALCRSRTR